MKHKPSLLELAIAPVLAFGIEGCTSSQTGAFHQEVNVPSASADHRLDSIVLKKESSIYRTIGPDMYELKKGSYQMIRKNSRAFTVEGDHDDGPHNYAISLPGLSEQENLELLKICTTKGAIVVCEGNLNDPIIYHELVHREFSMLSKEDKKLLDDCRRQVLPFVSIKDPELRKLYEEKVRDVTTEFIAQSLAGFEPLTLTLNPLIREHFPKKAPRALAVYQGIGDRALAEAIRYAQLIEGSGK